ncbi:MAG TPA: LacI family transcriptional regulator, partial [Mobilitalea sp.]|nr:LacI family transcriptional regulator [Mobilitalea sp.]
MKRLVFIMVIIVAIFTCTGCRDSKLPTNDKNVTEEKIQIGLSFDSFVIERWQRDRDVFVYTAEELGA